MARIWSSGFELNTISTGLEFTASSGTPSIQTSVVRSGTYALRISSISSGNVKGFRNQFVAGASTGPLYFRAYFRVDTLPSAENCILQLNDSNNFATPMVYITIDNAGVLRLYDEDGQITGTTTLSTTTWYRLEIEFDASGSAGSHVVRARVDGTEFASSTARSLSAGVLSYNVGGNLLSEAQTTGDWYFDDLAINNNSGSFQNSYPGAGSIVHLRPSGTGDNGDWTGSNTDIDEVTPNDATDFISSNTLDQIEDVNIDDTPAAINSGDTINCVQVGVRCNVADATGADPAMVLRIKASASGTVEESSATTLNTTTWRTHNSGLGYLLTLYDLPGASTTAWTKADLDTAQIGVRISTGDTHAAQVTALWLLVDYAPVVASGHPAARRLGMSNFMRDIPGVEGVRVF